MRNSVYKDKNVVLQSKYGCKDISSLMFTKPDIKTTQITKRLSMRFLKIFLTLQ